MCVSGVALLNAPSFKLAVFNSLPIKPVNMSSSVFSKLFDFKDDQYKDDLQWTATPDKVTTSENGLQVYMSAKSDFWQKTYYKPLLVNDNGHLLYKEISDQYIMMETEFDVKAGKQYDQAGLMVRLDTLHWIKTGVEYVDGEYQLSVVVTNGYSDWSVQRVPSGNLAVRVFRQDNDFIVEAKTPQEDKWSFIRICHLDVKKDETLKMGLMACAPTEAGGSAVFPYLKYAENKGYHHGGNVY